jgi:type IX secretion system PorP/SprF family membrane protein
MGPRNVTSIYGNFAYILKLTNTTKLSFGLNAGYNRYQFNFDKIDWKVDEVASQLYNNQTKGALDINGGLYLKSKTFFLGISASHLNNPSVYAFNSSSIGAPSSVSYRLRTHLFVSIGNSFVINDNLIFSPTALLKFVDGKFNADINMNFFIHRVFWVGGFYRTGFGPGMLVQYYITNKLRVGLSYDTGLKAASRLGSSFEAMFGFDFGNGKAKMINPRFL